MGAQTNKILEGIKGNKLINWIGTVITYILTIIIILAAILSLSNYSLIPDGIKTFSIQSGSMEPNIHVGSIVITKSQSQYKTGDIVTFKKSIGNFNYVTHRIVDETSQGIVTKGDANNVDDLGYIQKSDIAGRVLLTIPLIGYIDNFITTRLGVTLLIIIPCLLLIISESLKLIKDIKEHFSKKHTNIIDSDKLYKGNEKSNS